MTTPETVLVAAPEAAFRRSLQFALESAGFRTDGHSDVKGALASQAAGAAVCAVIDDQAIDNWGAVPEQLHRFARPVVLVVGRFGAAPELPRVTLVVKPFLGEPLIEAVRHAVADAARKTAK